MAAWDSHTTAACGLKVKPQMAGASPKRRSQPVLLPRIHFSWTFQRPRAILIRNILSKQFYMRN